jgi:hypothetical protein
MLTIAPSLFPILGSGVDIGEDIGGVDASDIPASGVIAGGVVPAPPCCERIKSIIFASVAINILYLFNSRD